MKKLCVLLLMILVLSGCGKVASETGGGSSGGGGGSTPTPSPRRLPISRPFTVFSGTITFTDTVVTAGISVIEYNAGQTPNITIRCESPVAGKSIIVLTRGGNISFTPTAGQVPDNFSIWVTSGSTSSTVFSLGATENIVDPANANNYIQLMIDGVVVEDYWLDDFLK